MPDKDALLLAQSVVRIHLQGVDHQGVARLVHDLPLFLDGTIDPAPTIAFESAGYMSGQVRGSRGHGIVVAHRAAELAIGLALGVGAGAVGVASTAACGPLALYMRHAAEFGLIAIGLVSDGLDDMDHGADLLAHHQFCSITWPREQGGVAFLNTTQALILQSFAEALSCEDRSAVSEMRLIAETLLRPLRMPALSEGVLEILDRQPLSPFFLVVDPARLDGGAALIARIEQITRTFERGVNVPGGRDDSELAQETLRRKAGIPIEPYLAQLMLQWSQRLGVFAPSFEIGSGHLH
jgi:ureidoglycolate dehydrogenase (NAD+)